MLRTNLSTRPFYNERLVHLGLALVAGIVVALTLLNLVQLVRMSRQNTTLSARIRDDRTAADDYARKARQTKQGINQEQLKLVVAAAREANALIDNRTFSWTEFLNHIEATLPPDVMLSAVRPAMEDTGTNSEAGTKVIMVILARRVPDIDEFMEKLDSTGAFENSFVRQQSPNEDGLIQATAETLYVPSHVDPVAKPDPAVKPGPAAKPESSPKPAPAEKKEGLP
jgi:hypothetical protein